METKKYHAGILLGAALLLLGLLLSIRGYDAFFLIVAGVAAIGTLLVRRWQTGDQPERDERINKIRAFSLAYSWYASLILTTVIFCAINLELIALDSLTALAAAITIMIASFLVSVAILQRRGDVA